MWGYLIDSVYLYLTMLRLTLITSLCLCLTMASAVNLDSLWGVWNDKSQPDTNRLKAIHNIAGNIMFSDPDSACNLAIIEYKLAKEKGFKKYMVTALNLQGVAFSIMGNNHKALDLFNKRLVIEKEEGNEDGMASAYGNMVNIYQQQGNHTKAIEYLSKSLEISERLNNKKGTAINLSNLGIIYQDQGEAVKAMENYKRSLKLDEQLGNAMGVAGTLINMGLVYELLDSNQKAQNNFKLAKKIFEKLGNKSGIANCLGSIGNNYNYQGELKTALDYYQQSLQLNLETGKKISIIKSYICIGSIFKKQGNYYKSIYYVEKALTLAHEVGVASEIKFASNLLYNIYKKAAQPAKALEMHELYIEMRDSINSMENKEAIIKLEYQYKYEKEQVLAEAKHQEQMALSAEREKRQQLIAYSAGGGLVMVLAFAFFILNRLQVTRRQKKVIEEQKQKVEEQKQKVEEQKKDITDSIQYAENIQRALLPTIENLKDALPDGFLLFQPKDIVSGDFYWMQQHNDKVYFAACDCTGHGVPGAFMSMIGSSLLDEAVEVRKGFINALKQTGEAGQQKDGMDATLIAWDKNNKLQYAVANNPILLIRKGELLETKPDRQPVGYHTEEQKPFTHHEVKLEKGDTVYLFSDGYPDQFGGPKDKKFMMKNFKKLLLSIQDKTMNEQKTILETTLAEWKGDTEQVDDILVIGVRF